MVNNFVELRVTKDSIEAFIIVIIVCATRFYALRLYGSVYLSVCRLLLYVLCVYMLDDYELHALIWVYRHTKVPAQNASLLVLDLISDNT